MPISLNVTGAGRPTPDDAAIDTDVDVDVVAIAGFTGRDQEAVAAHLAELAELGVPTPASTPCFYQAPPAALVQTDAITVTGGETSGEAEVVMITVDGDRYLTVGSDHTDRAVESIDIGLSKLVCPKPIASTAWRLADVEPHAERLELRSWVTDVDGTTRLYQEGLVGEFLDIGSIYDRIPFARPPRSVALFCGTLPAIGGIRPAPAFRAELADPVLGRTIEFGYETRVADYLAI